MDLRAGGGIKRVVYRGSHGGQEMNMYALSGLGDVQPPAGGIAPGSACYDPSHDGGIIHCASATNVILSALNPFGQQMTTTCSPQETACFQTAPPDVLNQNPTNDVCGTAIGINCSTLLGIAAVLVVGVLVLRVVTK